MGRFVPNFAAITASLSDLTKKRKLNQVVWTDTCQWALETVQAILSSDSILRLPDFNRQFIVRTTHPNRA
ncbi:Retrovirus-related Pol polyprotein from transposon 297 [Biomphalaria pfeifferi]|uniref:Retrovirus-related Pol polyprotein from transposon 297 n=1 Tax=Biomphalaria pfeifferi TaxID=112525 RepID=A0AAD8BYR2_BIOPF|nr:Retrovirus-related Pol polyprotein from transposon 297 [Biomphalaria pfeifferi]